MSKQENIALIFADIAAKQFELNNFTAGANWEFSNLNERTQKKISWSRAAWLEMAEFVESFDWKHWKKNEEDLENAKVELIDNVHFLTSQLIRDYKKDEQDNEVVFKKIGNKFADFFISESTNPTDDETIFDIAEDFVYAIIKKDIVTDEALTSFVKLCKKIDLSIEVLYKMYMVKNILNQFRQEFGYKEGNYIKFWKHSEIGLVEDNVVANYEADKLIENGEIIGLTLFDKLKSIYVTM